MRAGAVDQRATADDQIEHATSRSRFHPAKHGGSNQRRAAYAAGVVRLVGLWTEPADIDAFERDYLGAHFPQLAQLGNATGTRTSRAFDGPYFRLTEVMFDSADDIHAALETDTGERILNGARALEAKYGIHLDVMIVADPS